MKSKKSTFKIHRRRDEIWFLFLGLVVFVVVMCNSHIHIDIDNSESLTPRFLSRYVLCVFVLCVYLHIIFIVHNKYVCMCVYIPCKTRKYVRAIIYWKQLVFTTMCCDDVWIL